MKDFVGYKHGVNLGGWFSQCDYSKDRFDNFIKEEDFKTISNLGFDHVRIPVDYNLVLDDNNHYLEEGFKRLDDAFNLCNKYHLNCILDLHKTVGYSFDKGEKETGLFNSKEYQEKFYDLWLEFTKRFVKYEDFLAFELLNEVSLKEYKDVWNSIASTCIKKIRELSKTIKIIVGGYYFNSVLAVKDIDVPVDDNIVFNFHCYEPLLFTHQGAYWIDGMDTNFRFKYKSTIKEYIEESEKNLDHTKYDFDNMDLNYVPDSNFFDHIFKEAVDVANSKNVYLYCGEYGVIDKADINDTLLWYEDIHSIFNKYNIGHALWSYKEMDFGLMDSWMDPIREKLVK